MPKESKKCKYDGCTNKHHARGYCPKHYNEAVAWADKPSVSAKHEFVTNAQLSAGCGICGYNDHPAALVYDHIDPSTKTYPISSCMGRAWNSLIREINKCRVLCTNCHMIEHYGERYDRYDY